MDHTLLIAVLSSGTVSSLITLAVTPLVTRKRDRLDEAKIMSDISTQLREELQEERDSQKEQIATLKRVLITLTSVVAEVLPRISGISQDEKDRLSRAYYDAWIVS